MAFGCGIPFHFPFGNKHKNSTQSAQNRFGCNFMWITYSFMSEAAHTSLVCHFMSVQDAKNILQIEI